MEKKMNDVNGRDRLFLRGAAAAALLFLVYSVVSVMMMLFLDGGYPATAVECFEMLEGGRLTALLRLDILSVVVIPFYAVLFFGIYTAVKKNSGIEAGIALALVLGGIVVFMSTVNILSIVNLGNRYLNTASEEMRNLYLAAGEGMLADDMWINTGYVFRGLMIELGAVIFSVLIIRSGAMSKAVGWVGLFTHSFDFLSTLAGLFYAPMKDIFTYVAGPLYVIWFVMLIAGFIRLSSARKTAAAIS